MSTSDDAAQLRKSMLRDILVASLPAQVLLLLIPSELYIHNQDEFNNNLNVLLPYLTLFVEQVLRDEGLLDNFDGFTFYRQTRSNYHYTTSLLPAS